MNNILFLNNLKENIGIYLIIIILFLSIIVFYFIKYLFLRYKKDIFKYIKNLNLFIKNKIKKSKYIILFKNKFPKTYNFLKNRFDKTHFIGLPFSILFFIFLYIFNEFIGLTQSVINHGIITQVDVRLSDFFYYFKDSRLIDFFLFISYFADKIFVLVLSFLLILFLFLRGKIFEIIAFLSGLGVVYLGTFLSKIIFARPRPSLAVYLEESCSFPSMHASISVVLYGFIIYFILKKIKKYKRKVNLIFIFSILIFLIGFSRLYLNVHYLSDVISGWFLGFLLLSFGISILGFLKFHFGKIKFKVYKKKIFKKIYYILFIIFITFLIFNYKSYYSQIQFLNPQKIEYKQINDLEQLLQNNKQIIFTETISGRKTEPINFLFLAKSKKEIENIFKKSSWDKADKLGRTSLKKMGKNLLENKEYKTAPITPLYLNKKIQDLSFQFLPNKKTIKFRHHIRIWQINYKKGNNFIFVGCGIYDDGIKWGITHKIDPDLDKEREFIFESLKKSNLIKKYKKVNLLGKYSGENFSGDEFFTDGQVYILELK